MADLIIEGGTVVTVNDAREVIEDGAVAVDGRHIVAVGPTDELRAAHDADRIIDATGHAVMPGLITTHVHVADIMVRGGPNAARDVYDWLFNVKVPGISAMNAEEHGIAAALYSLEALQSGITTFVENAIGRGSGFDDDAIETKFTAYDAAGIRSAYAQAFSDAEGDEEVATHLQRVMAKEPSVEHVVPESRETDEALRDIERLIDTYHGSGDGLRSIWPAPYLTWGCTPEGFAGALDLAEQYDVMSTTHVSETILQERNPMQSIEYLNNIGYLGERTLLGHCVHITDRDIRLLAETDAKVAHNILANLDLADGIAPVPAMINHGVTVGMGTDNPSANDSINLINDLRFAALVHRGVSGDAARMTAEKVFEMATIDAARAIGREEELGSLEAGKLADVTLLDLDYPHLTPSVDPVRTIVSQAQGFEVDTVICNGEVVMDERRVEGIESAYPDLLVTANQAAADLRERTGIAEVSDQGWRVGPTT